MKNYFIKPGFRGMFSINKETEDIDVVNNIYSHIDWVYMVPEDGVLTMPDKTKKNVKKDDFVIAFYSAPYAKYTAVVVESSEWAENIRLESEYERQKEANKETLSDNTDCGCCPDIKNAEAAN